MRDVIIADNNSTIVSFLSAVEANAKAMDLMPEQ
jgi:hypothetical protein